MKEDLYDKIVDIDNRAQKIGIPMKKLCDKATISNSTFTRWKAKKTKPNFESYLKIYDALEFFEKKNKEEKNKI